MKHSKRISLSAFLAGALALGLAGCPGKNSPSSPASPTATPTPSGPYIVANVGMNGSSYQAWVIVSDSAGNSGTANTSVSLTTNSATESMTASVGLVSTGGATIDGAPYVTGCFYSGPVTYNAGQVYLFSVNVAGTTYSASATGFAGSPVVSPSSGSGGVTCSWATGAGNEDYIYITGSGLASNDYIGPPVPSNPYTISNSVFTNETPGSGNDEVNLQIDQMTSGAFPGAQSSSCVISRNVASASY